jgi:hypothetical protein
MLRPHRRYERMTHRGVLPQKAVVAMARELAGFIWGRSVASREPGRGALIFTFADT